MTDSVTSLDAAARFMWKPGDLRVVGRTSNYQPPAPPPKTLTVDRQGRPIATHLPFAARHPKPRNGSPVPLSRPASAIRPPLEATVASTTRFADPPVAEPAAADDSGESGEPEVPDHSDGAMVAAYPADPATLALTGDGASPPEELHITLAFLGDAADLAPASLEAARAATAELAAEFEPFDALVAGCGTLGDKGAVVLFLEADELDEMQCALWAGLDPAAYGIQHDGFLPHLTLGYGLPLDAGQPYIGSTISINHLALVAAGAVDPYPLGEDVPETDQPEVAPEAAPMSARQAKAIERLTALRSRTVYVDEAGGAASGMAASGTAEPMATATVALAAPAAEPIVAEDPDAAPGEMAFQGLLVVEGVDSGDQRMILEGALTWRELPLPLMAMFTNPDGGDGHAGAAIAGRIDNIWRHEDRPNELWGSGVYDDSPAGHEAYRMLQAKMLRGVSVDLDNVDVEFENSGDESDDPLEALFGDPGRMMVSSARIMGATQTSFPAFAEAHLEVIEDEALAASAGTDYRPSATIHTLLDSAGALVASGGLAYPENPPAAWFEAPAMSDDDRVGGQVRVDPDGRVRGYLAKFGDCHVGFGDRCVTVPRSRSAYSTFRSGRTVTAEGDLIPTGVLTTDTVHPSLARQASDAAAHYAHSGCGAADVAVGEDGYGVWVAGAMRRGASAEQLRALRGGGISGDWRPIRGNLELVAVLAVNTGGFTIGEALAASAGSIVPGDGARARMELDSGKVLALVAAGRVPRRPADEASRRIDALAAQVEQLSAIVRTLRADRARGLIQRFEKDAGGHGSSGGGGGGDKAGGADKPKDEIPNAGKWQKDPNPQATKGSEKMFTKNGTECSVRPDGHGTWAWSIKTDQSGTGSEPIQQGQGAADKPTAKAIIADELTKIPDA